METFLTGRESAGLDKLQVEPIEPIVGLDKVPVSSDSRDWPESRNRRF